MCLKRFDLQVAQIHQAAVRAQLELFRGKLEGFSVLDHPIAGPNAAGQLPTTHGHLQQLDANVSLESIIHLTL